MCGNCHYATQCDCHIWSSVTFFIQHQDDTSTIICRSQGIELVEDICNNSTNMPDPLNHLPLEVVSHILSFLRHGELTILMIVSKAFYRTIQPLIWTHIEFHRPDWHTDFPLSSRLASLSETQNLPKSRPYIYFPPDPSRIWTEQKYSLSEYQSFDFVCMERGGNFLLSFAGMGNFPPLKKARYHNLALRVRSLCITVTFDRDIVNNEDNFEDFWFVFSEFKNLESLELSGRWAIDEDQWDLQSAAFAAHDHIPPLVQLHTLQLCSYIPRHFAQWAVTGSERLTSLELSILDRPVGSVNSDDRLNPPPTTESDRYPLEDLEEDGGEIPWVTEDSDSDEEDLDHEVIAPRALTVFQDPIDIPAKVTANLSTLVLTRPAETRRQARYDTYCSIRSDTAILQEWASLIRASRNTLQHLVLDQRPFCEGFELRITDEEPFLKVYAYGPGTQRFKNTVLPVLLDENAEWPRLQSIQLYGFDNGDDAPSESFLPALNERFAPLGVRVESALGRRMVFKMEPGIVCEGDGLGAILPSD